MKSLNNLHFYLVYWGEDLARLFPNSKFYGIVAHSGVQCTVCSVQRIVYSVQCTVYSVQYNVQCKVDSTMYSVQYNVLCTVSHRGGTV